MDYYSIDFLRNNPKIVTKLQNDLVSVNVLSLFSNDEKMKKDESFVSDNFLSYNLCFCSNVDEFAKFKKDGHNIIGVE